MGIGLRCRATPFCQAPCLLNPPSTQIQAEQVAITRGLATPASRVRERQPRSDLCFCWIFVFFSNEERSIVLQPLVELASDGVGYLVPAALDAFV